MARTLDAIGAPEQLRKQFQARAGEIAAVGRDVLLALETTDLAVLRRTEMEAANRDVRGPRNRLVAEQFAAFDQANANQDREAQAKSAATAGKALSEARPPVASPPVAAQSTGGMQPRATSATLTLPPHLFPTRHVPHRSNVGGYGVYGTTCQYCDWQVTSTPP